MQDLGTLGGSRSEAYGVSADGAVVVGVAENAEGHWRAFRWTASGGMQDLGTLGGDWSWAYGVSADGAVVVGGARNAAGQGRAFRWTEWGMQDLGTLGGMRARLWCFRRRRRGGRRGLQRRRAGRAFRWTASGGMQDLGTLGGLRARLMVFPPTAPWWSAGLATPQGRDRAFRWTASGGMQDLGTLGGRYSAAYGVSADGSVVVGWAYNAAGMIVPFAGRRRVAWKT
jgi:probable HAF family extracellular repeat protein